MEQSPFTIFHNWLKDGNPNSELPDYLTSKTSPISHLYVLSLFCRQSKATPYINSIFNNYEIWYLHRKDLFKFFKKILLDLKISAQSLVYYKPKKLDKMYDLVKEKFPYHKIGDIDILLENISKNGNLEEFLIDIGVNKEKVKKQKVKLAKNKPKAVLKKYTLQDLMKNFEVVEL